MPAAYRSDTVVILGLGLIGGSLARALRRSGFSRRFVGYGHREASLRRGVELGVIDDFTLDLEQAVGQADILVVCTPTLIAADMLRDILPRLAAAGGPVITDVASVKGSLRDAAIGAMGAMPPRLVLAHPIAGSERSGVEGCRERAGTGNTMSAKAVAGRRIGRNSARTSDPVSATRISRELDGELADGD